jgi:hypothetical protein
VCQGYCFVCVNSVSVFGLERMKVSIPITDSMIIPNLHRKIHQQTHEYYYHRCATKTPILKHMNVRFCFRAYFSGSCSHRKIRVTMEFAKHPITIKRVIEILRGQKSNDYSFKVSRFFIRGRSVILILDISLFLNTTHLVPAKHRPTQFSQFNQ